MLTLAILAGGLAQRLRPITENTPKALVEIKNKPFVDWQLDLLSSKGISNVVFCVSYRSELIQEHVGDGKQFNLKISYSEDGEELLGTGGALKKALPLLGEKFMVIYGDSFLDLDYKLAEKTFIECAKPAMMTVYRNNDCFDKSNVKFNFPNVLEYNKSNEKDQFEFIDYGLNFFDSQIFATDKYGTYFDLSVVYSDLAMQGSLAGFEVTNRFYEVGSFKGISDFSKYLEER
jgi:hypothetical protein